MYTLFLYHCVQIRILLFPTVFVLDRGWYQSCTGTRSLLLFPSLCISLFVFMYWHSIVFMWVLAAAVVTRRLPPKRFGEKKEICFYQKQTTGSHDDM